MGNRGLQDRALRAVQLGGSLGISQGVSSLVKGPVPCLKPSPRHPSEMGNCPKPKVTPRSPPRVQGPCWPNLAMLCTVPNAVPTTSFLA